MLIIFNDNSMSIQKNTGGLHSFFKKKRIRSLEKKNFFEDMGFFYTGPINGHNINMLIQKLEQIEKLHGPKVLHVITRKGNGHSQAEKYPDIWHFTKSAQIFCGIEKFKHKKANYSQKFGAWLCKIAEKDKRIIAITPAMGHG